MIFFYQSFLLTCDFSLDKINSNENLNKDILDYITLRISSSTPIHSNVSSSVTGKLEGPSSSASATRFSHHLLSLCKGSILFAKLTLDLLERGHLVVKSSGYKVCSLVDIAVYRSIHYFLLSGSTSFPCSNFPAAF